MSITSAQRRAVFQRAGGCCEYCRVNQTDNTSPFHIDHVIPIKHHGTDELDNLAFSCYQCNSFKGSNMAAADPVTGQPAFLFNPRQQEWDDHFLVSSDGTLIGRTSEGRVTVDVMRMNEEHRVQYRWFAMRDGEYPCQHA